MSQQTEAAQKPLARRDRVAVSQRCKILLHRGRDLRDDAPGRWLRSDVLSLKDLKARDAIARNCT